MAQTARELRPMTAPTRNRVEGMVSGQDVRSAAASAEPGLLWRLVLVAIGFGIAVTGWMLVVTVFLSFIGLPLFMFGLALMQSQER
jgi:hypothetical protein